MLVAVVFELFVDRNEGTTTHHQWVQKTEESVIITGIYTHLLPMIYLHRKGFTGWYKVHQSAYDEALKMKGEAIRQMKELKAKGPQPEQLIIRSDEDREKGKEPKSEQTKDMDGLFPEELDDDEDLQEAIHQSLSRKLWLSEAETLPHAIRAAQLAGVDEFVWKNPAGEEQTIRVPKPKWEPQKGEKSKGKEWD